jgi:tetratricopeptide (TPR) repeat protein/serine phosphatase RsbU (regulator of sigma subunit)
MVRSLMTLRNILVLLFLWLNIQSYCSLAQPSLPKLVADSLWKIWNNPNEIDSNRLNALRIIAFEGYVISKPDSAFYYANLHYNFALKKNMKKQMADALNIQGLALNIMGDNSKAITYLTNALSLRDQINDKKGSASSLGNIGNVYLQLGEFDKALDYYSRCLDICKEFDNKRWISACLGNLAVIYKNKSDYSKAMEYNLQSLAIEEELGNKQGIAISLNNIGKIYEMQGEFEKGLKYLKRGKLLREEIGDKVGIANSYNNIGRILLATNKLEESHESHLQALRIAKESGAAIEIRDAAFHLVAINKRKGNYNVALNMYEHYVELKDSLDNETGNQEILKQELKYNYEKKAIADSVANLKLREIKDSEIARQQAVIKAKRNQQYALFGGLFLVVVFAGFMYNRFKLSQKQNRIIAEKEKETSTQKQIIESKHKEIKSSIEYAKRIQTAILPPPRVVKEFLKNSFILYLPKDIVAGDFYWMDSPSTEESGQGAEVFIAACDCTGHGVPGAMVSVVCNNALNRAVNEFGERLPGKIFDKARELVLENFEKSDEEVKDGMDASLCALDIKNKKLLWAGANNPLWIIRKNSPSPEELGLGAEVIEYKPDKQPIGKGYDNKPFTTHEISLQEGDIIYLFTDGYADQFGGEKGKKMTKARFREFVLSISHLSMEVQREALLKFHDEYRGQEEQVDDICVIGVRV